MKFTIMLLMFKRDALERVGTCTYTNYIQYTWICEGLFTFYTTIYKYTRSNDTNELNKINDSLP